MNYKALWYKGFTKLAQVISNTNWCPFRSLFNNGVYWSLTEQDLDYIRRELKTNYFIINTATSCHLSTHLIRIMSRINGSKDAFYSHVLMNTEDGATIDNDYKLIEATQKGVHYSTFMEVFACDAVALLKPKNMALEDWTAAIDAERSKDGLPYDNVFDLLDDTHMSCVELVLDAIKNVKDYENKFPNLLEMIKRDGNLTPQMFRDCPDFEVHWEVRR